MWRIATKECKGWRCTRTTRKNDFCSVHLRRLLRGSDPTKPGGRDRRFAVIEGDIAKLPLGVNAKDGYAIVDARFAYLDRNYWHLSNGYAKTDINGKPTLLHRLIASPSKGQLVDHKNHDTLDNRLTNLRVCSSSENNYNQIGNRKSSSRFKGVSWHKQAAKWEAHITAGKKKYLGLFENEEDAATAYNTAAKNAFGDFALLNRLED